MQKNAFSNTTKNRYAKSHMKDPSFMTKKTNTNIVNAKFSEPSSTMETPTLTRD